MSFIRYGLGCLALLATTLDAKRAWAEEKYYLAILTCHEENKSPRTFTVFIKTAAKALCARKSNAVQLERVRFFQQVHLRCAQNLLQLLLLSALIVVIAKNGKSRAGLDGVKAGGQGL